MHSDRPAAGESGSRWTDTFVIHSRNRLIHRIRYSFYERAFFSRMPDKGARILDVGCGSGEFISLLQQKGYHDLHGVEIDAALFDMAAAVIPDIRKSSATALPYADDTFDCIYMFNVMHHLAGPDEYALALAEMSRCTRDGGRIILIEPSRLTLYRLLKGFCFLASPVARFFRNFHTILHEEWPRLGCFLRNLDLLRASIAAEVRFSVVMDRKLFHQWIAVIDVRKGGRGA